MSVFTEFRRRNVYRVAAAYTVAAWLIVQVVETILPAFGFDETSIRITVFALAAGFVPAVVLSWLIRWTPDGLRLESSKAYRGSQDPVMRRRVDLAIIAVLGVAVVFFAADKYVFTNPRAPVEAAARATAMPSIAILPFVDMSPAGDHAYFADGLTEEVITLLSRVPGLRVVSRSSSFAYKDSELRAGEIAAELAVDYILEGSVRKNGNDIRITAQLIDASNDSHLWSETFDRQLEDVLAIQDEIAVAVIPSLSRQLLAAEPPPSETDREAYAQYFLGQHFYLQRTSRGYELAVEHLKRSIAIDDKFPQAWISLASAYINQAHTGQRDYTEAYELATSAVRRALELDRAMPAAHSARAWIAFSYEHDYATSARHFSIARSLAPDSSFILANASVLLEDLGRIEDSIELVSRAIAITPADSVSYSMRALRLMRIGRLDAAEDDLEMALKLSPGSGYFHGVKGLLRLFQGRPDHALASTTAMDDESLRLAIVAMAQYDLGNPAASDDALDELETGYAGDSAYNIAATHAWRHEKDEAFAWLDSAIRQGQSVFGIKTDPLLQSLHDDPRWEPLLERIGLSDAQVAAIDF